MLSIETREESTGGGEERWQACEEHLLKCQKMGSADERGEERGKEQGKSKKRNKLMSHLRWWRDFQVRRIGYVFNTRASLGEFVLYGHLHCVWVCIWCDAHMCECFTGVCVHAKYEQSKRGREEVCLSVCERAALYVNIVYMQKYQ